MTTTKDLGPALNWQQAIKRLGCSRSMFYQLVDQGVFPHAYRLGRQKGIRVPQGDVEAYLERVRVG